MTTIVTDGQFLAADSMIHCGGAADPSNYSKIQITDQRIFAMAGDTALMLPLIRWYEAGANPKALPTVAPGYKPNVNLWIFEDGKFYEIDWDVPYKLELGVPNVTGSGGRWAMGALLAGASVEKAVRIAIQCDPTSGREVQVVELPPHLQITKPPKNMARGKARGGQRRAEVLSPERRSEIAVNAANQRWSKENADH